MTPSQLSATLRRIASRIDGSERPSRSLVAREIRSVLSRMAAERGAYKVTFDENELLHTSFNGDQDWLNRVMKELEGVLEEHGIDVNQTSPGAIFISGDIDAFNKLTSEAASERPDDEVDLLLAYMDGHVESAV